MISFGEKWAESGEDGSKRVRRTGVRDLPGEGERTGMLAVDSNCSTRRRIAASGDGERDFSMNVLANSEYGGTALGELEMELPKREEGPAEGMLDLTVAESEVNNGDSSDNCRGDVNGRAGEDIFE